MLSTGGHIAGGECEEMTEREAEMMAEGEMMEDDDTSTQVVDDLTAAAMAAGMLPSANEVRREMARAQHASADLPGKPVMKEQAAAGQTVHNTQLNGTHIYTEPLQYNSTHASVLQQKQTNVKRSTGHNVCRLCSGLPVVVICTLLLL
jgi:hypothetical protein